MMKSYTFEELDEFSQQFYNPEFECSKSECHNSDHPQDAPHLTCGCGYWPVDELTSSEPKSLFWTYKPDYVYEGFRLRDWSWKPVWFGNDEWYRSTIVFGLPFLGDLVIPFKTCKEHKTATNSMFARPVKARRRSRRG